MKQNIQAPEKRTAGDGHTLAVNSIFHTIQGEGPFAGMPAVFVRMAGCNLQCPMCDTEYTERTEMDLDAIADAVADARRYGPTSTGVRPCSLVVITGGEPFRQPIGRLVMLLRKLGYMVQIETNGTLYQPVFPYTDDGVTIVCSPKAGSIHNSLKPWIKAWKYVATWDSIDPRDGLPTHALEHPNGNGLYRPPAGHDAPIYLQPVDERNTAANAQNMHAVVQACLAYGHRLCLQMHKIIGVD